MSDIQDLIHKTSIDCIEKGQAMEQERIIKLLAVFSHNIKELPMGQLMQLIKGETK